MQEAYKRNRPVEARICANAKCAKEFIPRDGGYNARYCSKKCKNGRVRHSTVEQRKKWRRNTYLATILHPQRYQKYLDQNNKSAKTIRTWLAQYKIENGCLDCGYNKHPAALQFDHNGPKVSSISEMRSSISRILKEIESGSCVIRCAICHSVKTWAEKNNIDYKPEMAK